MDKSITKKLLVLKKLQDIDKSTDELIYAQGSLPEELKKLHLGRQSLEESIQGIEAQFEEINAFIADQRAKLKASEKHLLQYTSKQDEVRNDREYLAIEKERELHQLDQQLARRRIQKSQEKEALLKEELQEKNELLTEQKEKIVRKEKEQENIQLESVSKASKLEEDRTKVIKRIPESLLALYTRLRKNTCNGLAVVTIQRNACGGCFTILPFQCLVEVSEKKSLLFCEHCGRILVGIEKSSFSNIEPVVKKKNVKTLPLEE